MPRRFRLSMFERDLYGSSRVPGTTGSASGTTQPDWTTSERSGRSKECSDMIDVLYATGEIGASELAEMRRIYSDMDDADVLDQCAIDRDAALTRARRAGYSKSAIARAIDSGVRLATRTV